MANKLKKIFSNNEYVHGGKLVFANNDPVVSPCLPPLKTYANNSATFQ